MLVNDGRFTQPILLVLIICFPLSLTCFVWNSLLKSIINVPLISPVRWLSAIIGPICISGWALQNHTLSVFGAAVGVVMIFVLTLSSFAFLTSLLLYLFLLSKSYRRKYHYSTSKSVIVKTGIEAGGMQLISNGFVACILAMIYMVDCGCGEQIIDVAHNYRCSWLAIATIGALSFSNGDILAGTINTKPTIHKFSLTSSTYQNIYKEISLRKILLSITGGFIVGLVYYFVLLLCVSTHHLLHSPPQWPLIFIGCLGGLIGSLVDTVLGVLLQFKGINNQGIVVYQPGVNIRHISGMALLDNHGINLASSLITALLLPYITFIIV